MQEYPIFRLLGSKESPGCKGVEITLPNGQEVGGYFSVIDAKIETGKDRINLVTMSFYARLPE